MEQFAEKISSSDIKKLQSDKNSTLLKIAFNIILLKEMVDEAISDVKLLCASTEKDIERSYEEINNDFFLVSRKIKDYFVDKKQSTEEFKKKYEDVIYFQGRIGFVTISVKYYKDSIDILLDRIREKNISTYDEFVSWHMQYVIRFAQMYNYALENYEIVDKESNLELFKIITLDSFTNISTGDYRLEIDNFIKWKLLENWINKTGFK